MKLNIRTKLLGGFLVIVALLIFISGLSIMKMAGMNSNSVQMQSYNFPRSSILLRSGPSCTSCAVICSSLSSKPMIR